MFHYLSRSLVRIPATEAQGASDVINRRITGPFGAKGQPAQSLATLLATSDLLPIRATNPRVFDGAVLFDGFTATAERDDVYAILDFLSLLGPHLEPDTIIEFEASDGSLEDAKTKLLHHVERRSSGEMAVSSRHCKRDTDGTWKQG
jgi:hypothetical protein